MVGISILFGSAPVINHLGPFHQKLNCLNWKDLLSGMQNSHDFHERYLIQFQISTFMIFCYSITNKCGPTICFSVQPIENKIESVHANVLPTLNFFLKIYLTTDDKSRHANGEAQNSKRVMDFDFFEATFLTLRQVKKAFAHRCFARLRKGKRHSRVPKRHKIHGVQRYPFDPFLKRIYAVRSFRYETSKQLPRRSKNHFSVIFTLMIFLL